MQSNSSSNEIINRFEEKIQEAFDRLEQIRLAVGIPKTPEELESLEHEIAESTDNPAGQLIGLHIQLALPDEKMKDKAGELVKNHPERLKNNGNIDVPVKVLRGGEITVKVTFYISKGNAGKKRGKGIYAGSVLLGIHDRFSPGLASDVSMTATAMGSLEEAREILDTRGITINIKTLRNITYRYALRARSALKNNNTEFSDKVTGRKVVISVDGGRIRIRKNWRGPETRKGRPFYHTNRREPVLLNIYTVNENGKKDPHFRPFIDGTLKGPDAIFMLLRHYLSKSDIARADTLVSVADGAPWIWNRMDSLLKESHLNIKHVYELSDFYHAVEHLGKVASLCKSQKDGQRLRQVKKHRKLLKAGKIDIVTYHSLNKKQVIIINRGG